MDLKGTFDYHYLYMCVCMYGGAGVESRALSMLDKSSTTELHPQPTC